MKGDIFDAPKEVAEELIKLGLVEPLEPKKKETKGEKHKKKDKK